MCTAWPLSAYQYACTPCLLYNYQLTSTSGKSRPRSASRRKISSSVSRSNWQLAPRSRSLSVCLCIRVTAGHRPNHHDNTEYIRQLWWHWLDTGYDTKKWSMCKGLIDLVCPILCHSLLHLLYCTTGWLGFHIYNSPLLIRTPPSAKQFCPY